MECDLKILYFVRSKIIMAMADLRGTEDDFEILQVLRNAQLIIEKKIFDVMCKITENVCNKNNVKFHIGRAFSIDSVFAQYAHIDEILNMGCNVIEMETASAFRAAGIANLRLAAIFSVSDNTVTNKSLISGRTENDMKYRRFVRNNLFPEIITKVFGEMSNENDF